MYTIPVSRFIERHVSKDKKGAFIAEFRKFITVNNNINLDLTRILWEKSVLDSLLRGI